MIVQAAVFLHNSQTGCSYLLYTGMVLWQALPFDLTALRKCKISAHNGDTKDALAGTTIFSKAVVVPGQAVQPECKIPPFAEYGGIKIPTPCLFSGLWP